MAPYLFVIDTADYSGNFEREMCAYITGRVGECGVGKEMLQLFEDEIELELFDNVMDESDEHSCRRPVFIYPTPGYFNDGLGGHFKDVAENQKIGKQKWPAYQSVAIFFDRKPTKKQIELMKERTMKFANLPAKTYGAKPDGSTRVSKILGFRLISQVIKKKVKEIALKD